MSIRYEIHPDDHLLVIEVHAVLDDDQVRDTISEIQQDPDWHPDLNQLVVVDARDADPSDLSGDAISAAARRVTRIAEESPGSLKVAIVVIEPLQYGLARMYEAFSQDADSKRVRVFRSLEGAFEWLGTGSPDLVADQS